MDLPRRSVNAATRQVSEGVRYDRAPLGMSAHAGKSIRGEMITSELAHLRERVSVSEREKERKKEIALYPSITHFLQLKSRS